MLLAQALLFFRVSPGVADLRVGGPTGVGNGLFSDAAAADEDLGLQQKFAFAG
jgi:hypothetical protein